MPLASLNSGDDIVSALAETVGFRFYKAEEPKQQLLDFLRQKQMLLVLDNFEHLLATGAEASHSAAVLVTEILQAAPQVKILTTSRERLNLSGETVYSLTGLAFPGQAASQAPLEFDAVKLLLQQTRLLRPNFEPQQVDFPEMIRICQLTQGMPLAIVLAAGWLEVLSLKEIADEIAQSLDFLETTMRDAPERQRSVRAAFEYSWKRLLPDEQQIFMRLSVFRGGFTRQAAQTVAEAGVRALRTLINKSLITLNQNERYEVHELLRQYAEEKLGKTDEADRIRTIHSNYYLKILHHYEAGIKGPRQLELLRGIEADLENIRSAWVWALEQKNLPAIEGALETLHLFFYIRTRLQEGILFFERAQEQLKPLPNQAVWGRILLRLSFLQSFMQAASDNKSQIEQGLLIAQRQGQEREIAFGLLTLGAHHSDAHDYATALKYFEQSLHYYRTVDDRFYLADLLLWIGHCYGQLAGLADYRVYMEQSLVLSRQAGDKTHLTIALVNLGDTALCAGEYEAAVNYCEEALTLAHEMSRRTSESEIETRLGLIAFLKGDFEQASTLVEAGLVKARDIHYTVSIVRALLMRSLQASLGGDYNLGQLLVEESLTLPVLSFELILRNWALAVAHCGLQNYEAARRSVQQALSLAQKMAYPALLTWLLPVAAVVLAQEGQKERAVTLLALAATHPLSPTGWQQQWPLLAELRRDLKAELAPEQFQVAWQRGQELDLELAVAELKAWEI